MDIDETDDVSAQSKGLKRKAGSGLEDPSEEENDESIEAANVVRDVLQTNLEIAAANAELQRKLQAAANTMKLMAQHAGVEVDQVDDWVYAQQLGQEQLQDQADAEAGVELTTPPSTSSEHVEANLTKKVVRDTTKDRVTPIKSTEKRPSKDKNRTPKGAKKNDHKSGSSKSKKPRLEETLKERSTKDLYNAYLESQKKDKAGPSGTQNAGCSPKDKASTDKDGDHDSDADTLEQGHGEGEDNESQSSLASWEDIESEAGSKKKAPRTGLESLNKRVEEELEAERIRRKEEKRLRKEAREAKDAKDKALQRAKKREEKDRRKKAEEEAFKEALNEEIVMVSSDESSDTAEGLSSKTMRLENIKMQNKVEEAYKKEQRRKERARQALRTGSGFGTLTGEPRGRYTKRKSIINLSLQRVLYRRPTKEGAVRAEYCATAYTPQSGSCRGTVYNISTPNNDKSNSPSSPGSATWWRSRRRRGRRTGSARTNRVAGTVRDQEVAGAGGLEIGETKEGSQLKPVNTHDFSARTATFMNIVTRVPVNLAPPSCPPLKAIGSPRSQQTQPTVAHSTTPNCLNPRTEIKNKLCTRVNLPGLSQPKAVQRKQGPQFNINSPDNLIKKWSTPDHSGYPIIHRQNWEGTYNIINTENTINSELGEYNTVNSPTCINPVVHRQNNQHTFAHLTRQNMMGTTNKTRNKKPCAKIKSQQNPARIDKTVPRINHTDGRSTQKSTTQPSIMNYITKGRKRLNLVQLTTSDNNKKLNTRIIPTNRDYTVAMIREILNEIVESTYPITVPSIFDHLKTKKPKVKKIKPTTKPPVKNLGKMKNLGFKCGICTKEYPSIRTLNTHCVKTHPKKNLLCTSPKCTFKTKLEIDLQDHIKTEHEKVTCKECGTITIGYAQKLHHENSVHGKETHIPAKVWIQPKKPM